VVRVGDACSHWPRLWRVMVSDAELEEMRRWRANDESEEERKLAKARETTNEKPTNLHPRLKTVFKFLDEKRRRDLSHPEEGIVFCSIDMWVVKKNEFAYAFTQFISSITSFTPCFVPLSSQSPVRARCGSRTRCRISRTTFRSWC
jgi:hypothetical protein